MNIKDELNSMAQRRLFHSRVLSQTAARNFPDAFKIPPVHP